MKPSNHPTSFRITAFAGGVGGAKLANGLAQAILDPARLTIIVNTGDDFEHLGMRISPDLDTVCYTLAGLSNPVTGWGRKDETWQYMQQVKEQGLPDWFNIGDLDRQTHLERTQRLETGETLTQVTKFFCQKWGIQANILPMSDDLVPTIVDTIEHGEIGFQEYFVYHHCEPRVKGFTFQGHQQARVSEEMLNSIQKNDLLVFCPSNPWVSIDPILSLPGVRAAVASKKAIAVSPIIGGKAVKGPAAKMFQELGIEPSALSVARHYQDLLRGFVLDEQDQDLAGEIETLGIPVLVTDTIMTDTKKQAELARQVVEFNTQIKAG
jgi:LPPG:FO 2-phospho-L-lactate transferase